MAIHPTAFIDPNAQIDVSADVGPYVVIDGPVQVGPHTHVYPHAYLAGWTTIGAGCVIHPNAVVGHLPQDLAFKNVRSYCTIGDETVIREGASVHRGTQEDSETIVGRRCYLMACSHVAHNCRVGNEVKMANGAVLAGHVTVGDGCFLSAYAGVHQFVRMGELVMVASHARVIMDVPPYLLVDELGKCVGINVVGLRRAGIGPDERLELKNAFRLMYRSGGSQSDNLRRIESESKSAPARKFLEFLRAPSKRGIAGVADGNAAAADQADHPFEGD